VIRGGSFENTAENARSAYRNRNHRSNRWDNAGFRPASSLQREMEALFAPSRPMTASQCT